MILYRKLARQEVERRLFDGFVRHQVVDLCLRRGEMGWVVQPDPFVDDWSEEELQVLTAALRKTLEDGGVVYAAFAAGELKGFASVKAGLFGGENRYLDLAELHVSEELRHRGIGTVLFRLAASWARRQGAEKLYLSAHSAVESQRFYRHLGCVDAAAPSAAHLQAEPFDCQLEYSLNR